MKTQSYRRIGFVCSLVGWIVLASGGVVMAVSFAGGTGEPNDPYQIATAEHLIGVGQDPNLLSRHFVLVSDIDLDPNLPGGKIFTQTVMDPFPFHGFTGCLDGQGHVIQNLVMNSQRTSPIGGLIGIVNVGGVVRNLDMENFRIKGDVVVGGLVGVNNGDIISCSSMGSVTGIGVNVGGLVGNNRGTIVASHAAGDIQGSWAVGGLVGLNWRGGIISSCHSSGRVNGDLFVGGLVGRNLGTLASCHSTGNVMGESYVGGLAGEDFGGTLSACYSTGSVMGGTSIGGLVGRYYGGLFRSVTSCHATGDVTGDRYVGGLVGDNSGTITFSYSTGRVTGGTSSVGGLVGKCGGTVSHCYSIGLVTGENEVGGLVGVNLGDLYFNYAGGEVTSQGKNVGGLVGSQYGSNKHIESCYFLAQVDGGGPDNGIGTDLTMDQMKQQGSFVGWDFWGTQQDGFSDDWFVPKGSYPFLVWQTDKSGLQVIPDIHGLTLEEAARVLDAAGLALAVEVQADFDRTIPHGYVIQPYYPRVYAMPGSAVEVVVSLGPYDWANNPGDGTEARPYEIQTSSQLDGLVDHLELWNKYFVQTADIDMAGRTYPTALIAPDVNDADGFQGSAFTGSLDGQGFQILNLGITTESNDYLGLFGFIGQGATVRGVNLVMAQIEGGGGSSYVGTLAGYSAGTVTDCSATGVAAGGCEYVDRLIGGDFGVSANNTSDRVVRATYCSEP